MKLQKSFLQADNEFLSAAARKASVKYVIGKLTNVALLAVLLIGLSVSGTVQAQASGKNRMTPELLWKLGRLGEAVTSPDAKQIAYTVRRYELAEDQGSSSLHVMNVTDSKDTISLKDWGSIGSINWMSTKDGDRLFFEGTPAKPADAKEDDDGPSNQAYSLDVATGTLSKLTSVEDGIANLKVASGGSKLAFTLDVKLDQKPTEIYPNSCLSESRTESVNANYRFTTASAGHRVF